DTICTSANAVQVCKAITKEWNVSKVLMGPDMHLSYHVHNKTGIDVITMPEKGCCVVHDQFTVEDVNYHRKYHPEAKIIVHPECPPGVQDNADFVGSTSQMIRFVQDNHSSIKNFVIGTEQGMIDHLVRLLPGVHLLSLSPVASGVACRNMKKTTLEKVHALLVKISGGNVVDHVIAVDETVAKKAKDSIDHMFALTRGTSG
nr:quinolinate synthase NadA [Candidatus Sigynarchaeota archaeon]